MLTVLIEKTVVSFLFSLPSSLPSWLATTNSSSWSCKRRSISFRRFFPSARFRPRCFPGLLVDPGRRAYMAVGIYKNRRRITALSLALSLSLFLVSQRSWRFFFQSLLTPTLRCLSVSSNRCKRTGSGPLQGLARFDSFSAISASCCSSSHRLSTRAFISQSTAVGFALSPSVKEDRINPLSSHNGVDVDVVVVDESASSLVQIDVVVAVGTVPVSDAETITVDNVCLVVTVLKR
mmetsp:Transcript_14602/g.30133  ORF Transcript_14602/g.30133 Transcript_14602/m.30133 type:complete len:235 (+) Transcript_14602:781-1485(+)